MANPENLKGHEFKPGESGNPNGRPKGKSFKTVLEALLDLEATDKDMEDEDIKKLFPDPNSRPTNREIIMAKMTLQAKRDPDSKSAERIMNRVDGKPIETVKQTHEITTDKTINLSIDGKDIELGK